MPLSIGMLSTHPPTQCGLATFNAALWAHLDAPGGAASVVRVVEVSQPAPGPEVVVHLVNGDPRSWPVDCSPGCASKRKNQPREPRAPSGR